jgi:Bacterial Ig-like domain (group 1)
MSPAETEKMWPLRSRSPPAGTTLPALLRVKVTDQYGNLVPRAVVNWTDDTGGHLTESKTTTDENGIALNGLTLSPSTGSDNVVAMIVDNAAPVLVTFVEDGR